jgi:hypothetical protein
VALAGPNGQTVTEAPVPADLTETVEQTRTELIEMLAEVGQWEWGIVGKDVGRTRAPRPANAQAGVGGNPAALGSATVLSAPSWLDRARLFGAPHNSTSGSTPPSTGSCGAQADDEFAEAFLSEEPPTVEQIKAAVRRATIALKFVPVLCGSAYKNKGAVLRRGLHVALSGGAGRSPLLVLRPRAAALSPTLQTPLRFGTATLRALLHADLLLPAGVQLLLNGVVDYLPNPTEKPTFAMDRDNDEAEVRRLRRTRRGRWWSLGRATA